MNRHDIRSTRNIRIVLFGSEGGFSTPILEQLLAHGLCVSAVVVIDASCNKREFPVSIQQAARPGGLEEMAIRNNVLVLKAQTLNDDTFLARLTNLHAEVLFVACFAHKIPARIWREMNLPCWNLHPSLLPLYRGPSPLYWQIRYKEAKTGLTLHQVSSGIDAGDIVAQIPLPLPEKPDKDSLNHWVAVQGANLFHITLLQHLQGTLQAVPQDEMMANDYPYPPKENPEV